MKKFLRRLSLAAVILAALALFGAPSLASAHTPEVLADCNKLSVNFTNYEAGNTVSVVIDGSHGETIPFDGSLSRSWDLEGTGHTYIVTVDAPGTEFDRTFSDAIDPCPVTEEPSPSPSPSTDIGTPEGPGATAAPDDTYAPTGPGPDETATPSPLPADSGPQGGEGLAVTGGEIAGWWIAISCVVVGGTLMVVSQMRRRAANR
jgi:hypothetical protein